MSNFEKKRLDREFNMFTSKHFEKPSRCKNLGMIQFYIRELTNKIDEYKRRFNYVPSNAYSLLSEYNASQNKLVFNNFQQIYR